MRGVILNEGGLKEEVFLLQFKYEWNVDAKIFSATHFCHIMSFIVPKCDK